MSLKKNFFAVIKYVLLQCVYQVYMKEKKQTNYQALVNLLDEPDELVFQQIRDEIHHHGMDILPMLVEAHKDSFDDIIRQRSMSLIQDIYFDDLYEHFSELLQNKELRIQDSAILLSKLHTINILEENILFHFSSIYVDVWKEFNERLTALEKIKIINHIIFQVHGFSIVPKDEEREAHFFPHTTLFERRGSEISLSILYHWIAEKLNLPLKVVLLPGKIILAYLDERDMPPVKISQQTNILFYINPSDKGAVFSRKEITKYLKMNKIPEKDSYFQPVSNRKFITHYLLFIEKHTRESIASKAKQIRHLFNE
jgi:regulator of sirC expression with transglutaminase-like and TPR domain